MSNAKKSAFLISCCVHQFFVGAVIFVLFVFYSFRSNLYIAALSSLFALLCVAIAHGVENGKRWAWLHGISSMLAVYLVFLYWQHPIKEKALQLTLVFLWVIWGFMAKGTRDHCAVARSPDDPVAATVFSLVAFYFLLFATIVCPDKLTDSIRTIFPSAVP